MKTLFISKVVTAAAVSVMVVTGLPSVAQSVSTAPAVTSSGLPANIQAGSPAAQVIKLVQAGVDASVIQTFISNCPNAFNVDADKIIALSDAGVPGTMIDAMIAHDKNFLGSLPYADQTSSANTETTSPPATTENSTATYQTVPPSDVSMNYFYTTLAPYGSWVTIDGYGRCWRPTVVIYDSSWRPYCDRGHWVYTDYGWYWDSDYAWGITFHYGRWFHNARYGWCWWPNTVWAPSWVTWRYSGNYCGWAPLPPYSHYRPGIGFVYRNRNVALSFGFGLPASYFNFVSSSYLCASQPRYHCLPRHDVDRFFHQTRVVNNYRWHDRRMVNDGISVKYIGETSRRTIHPVPIRTLSHGHRDGWRDEHNAQFRGNESYRTRNVNEHRNRDQTVPQMEHRDRDQHRNDNFRSPGNQYRQPDYNRHSNDNNRRDQRDQRDRNQLRNDGQPQTRIIPADKIVRPPTVINREQPKRDWHMNNVQRYQPNSSQSFHSRNMNITPARPQQLNHNNWSPRYSVNHPWNTPRPYNPPKLRQELNPQHSYRAPAANVNRQQHFQPRQSPRQSAPVQSHRSPSTSDRGHDRGDRHD